MRHIATMVFGEYHLIRLIPIGLSIGTGTLFESGYSLWIGGPVCLILAYLWTGSIQYAFTVGNIYSGLDKLTDS
jgi:amino acid permease